MKAQTVRTVRSAMLCSRVMWFLLRGDELLAFCLPRTLSPRDFSAIQDGCSTEKDVPFRQTGDLAVSAALRIGVWPPRLLENPAAHRDNRSSQQLRGGARHNPSDKTFYTVLNDL